MANLEDKRICHGCIGDHILKAEVRASGKKAKCDYCSKVRKTITIEALSERIDDVFQDHFSPTPDQPDGYEPEWERDGYPVANMIADMVGLGEGPAEDVRECLSGRYGYSAIKDGGEDPYAFDEMYEEKGPDDWDLRETWSNFRSEIRSHARFFSKYVREALDDIFEGLPSLRAFDGKPVIREIKPTDKDRFIYRAQVASSDAEIEEILKDPPRRLGPPPSRKAKAGRMNAAGIPVFYGAMDEDTCVAEVRAPVGSHVVVGRFEIIKPLRLLDFDVLTKIYVDASHFDPEYKSRVGRAAFLRRLVGEISRPVMPRDEEFEYLPTQAVAEYLAECVEPRIDGIIFHSSQTAGEGRNIVLFNHACGVEKYVLPEGTKTEISMGWGPPEEMDDDITIWETVPSEKPEPEEPADSAPFGLGVFENAGGFATEPEDELDEAPGQYNPSLRLELDSVHVLDVERVKYKTRKRRVSRHRSTKDEDENLPF